MNTSIAFSAQLLPVQLEQVKEKEFLSVINNRPDDEGEDQPKSADIEKAAQDLGLEYAHIPVVAGQMTQQNIEDFAQTFNQLPKPVLMFCRTGTRSNNLYDAAKKLQLIEE